MAFPYGQPNYSGGMNYNTYQPPYQLQMQQQMQTQPQVQQTPLAPKTNKIFVTSLEEAMNRSVEPNSVIIYLHQDLPLLFEISTDFFGKKTYKTFDISEAAQKPPIVAQHNQSIDLSAYATKEDLKALETKIMALSESSNKAAKQSKNTDKSDKE